MVLTKIPINQQYTMNEYAEFFGSLLHLFEVDKRSKQLAKLNCYSEIGKNKGVPVHFTDSKIWKYVMFNEYYETDAKTGNNDDVNDNVRAYITYLGNYFSYVVTHSNQDIRTRENEMHFLLQDLKLDDDTIKNEIIKRKDNYMSFKSMIQGSPDSYFKNEKISSWQKFRQSLSIPSFNGILNKTKAHVGGAKPAGNNIHYKLFVKYFIRNLLGEFFGSSNKNYKDEKLDSYQQKIREQKAEFEKEGRAGFWSRMGKVSSNHYVSALSESFNMIGWFIENEQVGRADERACHSHTLALPTRKRADVRI